MNNKRVVFSATLLSSQMPEPQTMEDAELVRILGRQSAYDFERVREIIDALDRVNMVREGECLPLDATWVLLSIYHTGMIDGIRKERKKRKGGSESPENTTTQEANPS